MAVAVYVCVGGYRFTYMLYREDIDSRRERKKNSGVYYTSDMVGKKKLFNTKPSLYD